MSKWITILLSLLFAATAEAKEVELTGTIPVVLSEELHAEPHIVYVQEMWLSNDAERVLAQRFDDPNNLMPEPLSVPARIDLGMNGTPAFDQGAHGSCVTFALTASLDAIIGKGDYISQLCSLELGDYLHRHQRQEYSGWEGTFGTIVLQQFADYGFITKKYQTEYGCAGVKQYPTSNAKNTGKPMSISEFSANAIPINKYASWDILVDMDESFSDNHNPTMLLRTVKKNLRAGNRVIFGTLLDLGQKHAGALGNYRRPFDSWVLTPEIIAHAKKGKIKAGHQMLIIGYDDNAIVTDLKGKTSKGVFIIRNSWGSRAGDNGNFYMSYDYFKTLSDEAEAIVPLV